MKKKLPPFAWLKFCYVIMMLALVPGLLGYGCSDSTFPAPIPESITPAVGYNGLPTEVSIKGKHLYRSMTHNLSTQDEFSVDSRFIAELVRNGQPGIGQVLKDVAYLDDQTLTATIAPGMDVGLYDLMVTDPRGLTGLLSDAFTVTDQAPPALVEITPFQVVNDSDTPFMVLGSSFAQGLGLFAGELQLETREVSTTQIESTVPAGFPEGVHSVIVRNPDGQSVVRADGIQVFGPALLTSSLMVSPQTTRIGESLRLDLSITNQGKTAVEMLSAGVPVVWGDGSALMVSGPTPDSVNLLAPSETQVFSWDYQAEQPGQLTFEARADGINQYSGRNIETGAVQSETVRIIECTDASECHNPTPMCMPSGLCSACTTDEQCTTLSPDYQRCDTSTGSCLPCLEHADCGAPWPYCDLDTNACVECLEALDCNDTNICTDDTCVDNACVYENNTAPCNDGLFCTAVDNCSLGICTGSGDPCSGGMECADTCGEINDTCNLPTGTFCTDDGIECTNDQCDGLGACTHPDKVAGASCGLSTDDDCTNPDSCNGSGSCLDNHESSGTACTDNGIECTDDQCDGAGSCTHPDKAAGESCGLSTDDDCTNPDTCNGLGSCLDNHEGSGTACTDDGIECTDDQCDGLGACTHPDKASGVPCGLSSDDDCTNPDTCNGLGSCLDNHEGSGTACTDDGIECTDDQCDGLGACTHPDQAAGVPCGLSTDDDCTKPDTCNGLGSCLDNHEGSGTACTDDGIECTDDQCDGMGTCTHPDKAMGEPCTDDGAFCTGTESCNGTGACVSAGDPCSGQLCDESGDECKDYIVIDDPVLDGSSFSFVFAYRGLIWVGSRADGTGAVSMNPDGSSPTSVTFSFFNDPNGNGNDHNNTSADPYPSIGFTGCTENTSECGPDNEDGRGLFCSGNLGGSEWLIIGGGRLDGDLDYVYMTLDNDAVLDFSFLDLKDVLGSNTKGISAAHIFGDRLYMGFPDTGGSKPYLAMVLQTPTQPGLDAVSNGGSDCEPGAPEFHDACDLRGKDFPEIGNSADPSGIDSITDYNDRLYIANYGGIARSTTNQPLDIDHFPGHWTGITPLSNNDYTDLTSYATDKSADLEPADKAIPDMASFGGRLFFARNTTLGPQLWRCTPTIESGPLPATAQDCDPGDWQLIAPNTTGNIQLTQFNNSNNTRITLLEASASYLYVGYNNADPTEGVVLFRTANPAAVNTSDFEGDAGCSADQHPASCDGIGGNGFGDPTITRIFSYVVASLTGTDWLYIIVGNGSDPVKLFIFSG